MTNQTKNLQSINTQMIQVMNKLEEMLPILTKLETEYDEKFYKLMLQGGESTQAAREASAKLQLRMPGENGEAPLFERYSDAKLEVRILLTKKEMLFELSRNLRAMR